MNSTESAPSATVLGDLSVPSMEPGNGVLDHNKEKWWLNFFPDDNDHINEITFNGFLFRCFGFVFCVLLIFTTLFGNVLVIIVVAKYPRMRSVTNVLLASLASADITVALLVMPFLVIYDFWRKWPFSSISCHLWISCDVLTCTVDRFWAVTRPLRYRSSVNKRRLFLCISMIWICSGAISFIPILSGWYHDGTVDNIFSISEMPDCSLKVNRVYAVISSMTSFFLPLPIMFYVYFRILLIAERQAREIRQLELSLQMNGSLQGYLSDAVSSSVGSNTSSDAKRHVERNLRRRSRRLITDTKAIRTLGIVMGVFCACWLPYFIMYLVSAYCDTCDLSYEVRSAITWLGYVNSSFNPGIYAFLNKDFKTAFRRVLGCAPRVEVIVEGDRDAMMDEISTTSRNFQRMDRLHVGIGAPSTPGLSRTSSRTPSATPETSLWPKLSTTGHLIIPNSTPTCGTPNHSLINSENLTETSK